MITGAATGIGAAVAVALAGAGAATGINHVGRGSAAEKLVRQVDTAGGKAYAVEADVTSAAQIQAMIARTERALDERGESSE